LTLFIILGLPVLFWLAGWIFVKFWRDPKIATFHACPYCGLQGQIASFGKFQCATCGQVFFVSGGGRNVRSLWLALRWPLVSEIVCGLMIIGIAIYLGQPWWVSDLYWLQGIVQMSFAISRKRFPVQPL
jgi:hypothetical protein